METDLLDREKIGALDIDKRGKELKAMNDLSSINALNSLQGTHHLITQRQIGEVITILKKLEYNFAEPAINALRLLPVVDDYCLADDGEIPENLA